MRELVGPRLECLAQSITHTASRMGLLESRELSVHTVVTGLDCHGFTHFEIGNFQVLIIITAVHLIK